MESPSARAMVRDLMTGVHSPLVTAAGSAAMRQTAGSVAVARSQIRSRDSVGPTVTPESMRVFGPSRTPDSVAGEMSWSASQYRRTRSWESRPVERSQPCPIIGTKPQR